MVGRYGNDRLNQCLMIVALVFLVISIFVPGVFYLVALGIMIYVYFRMLSRNIGKRSDENRWYLAREMKVRGFIQRKKNELRQRKDYHIYKCPNCKQKLRVPRGRGQIVVRCRKCGTEFTKKS